MAQSGASRGAPGLLARAHHGSVSKEQRALIEDDLKAGRLPVCRGDPQPRARHRHGCGRPGDPGRVAARRSPADCSASACGTPGRRGVAWGAVPQAPRRPAADRGRGRADARRRHRGATMAPNPLDVLAQQIVPRWPLTRGRRRAVRAGRGGRPRSRRCRARPSTPPSTCWPADTRPTSSPSCGPRIVGTGSPAAHGASRRAAAGGDLRRHHPRPRPVRRLPRRRGRRQGPGRPGRRARRGDGLRVPGG